MTNINETILTECGLSQEQALIYTYLLKNGLSPAKIISLKTNLGRPLVYKVLEQLIELNLVEKRDDIGKVSLFFPKHPKGIQELLETKKQHVSRAFSEFGNILGKLSSEFNSLNGKPNVQFYEGIEGIKYTHNDILETNQNILVISSPIHEGRQEVLHLIKEQIDKQIEKNIHTKAITPHTDGQIIATPIEEDTQYLITRKKVPADRLKIPAQIVIYGDKVAITNFKESYLTVVIESKYITETFRIMFEYIWSETR
jgi:sugar-specific transcriptional regulator TrmB